MLSLSVRENVLLRPLTNGDEQLVENALRESGIYDKLSGLENGLDSILTREFDDKGVNLSIGEQQKLSLARVFADSTPFVILDEPSSALDPIAEYKMFENMMKATEGRRAIRILQKKIRFINTEERCCERNTRKNKKRPIHRNKCDGEKRDRIGAKTLRPDLAASGMQQKILVLSRRNAENHSRAI